ncbi:Metalloprotease [Crepidotus variabilis]|uniref:Neutral protease 2 n=1 Tax=Crepidotus variabilis TaxID=179855 RepID=A0A9P6JV87_9AGAR|nr:Metalloprotease [Crepidotus variabilis]
MFWSTLSCLALASSALATPFKRAESLSVEVTPAAASVDTVDNLKFTASVKNNGAEAVKVLTYGTILDNKLPTKSFVVSKDGRAVPFTGIKLSVSLEQTDDSAFTTINPGQTVTVAHEVAALYDFSSSGVGKYTFAPNTNFVFVDDNTKEKSIDNLVKAEVTSAAVEVEVTGGTHKRELKALEGRATVSCSNASQKSFITSSYSEAKSLASTAASYINSRGASDSLFKAYYGTNSVSSVVSKFNAVANENSSSRTLNCSDPYGACSNGVIAYTLISSTNIYFCSPFYSEVTTSGLCSGTSVASRNIRGGTTLHELTHAVAGTDDVTYGCSADQALSNSNKLINADNYNCFSTQVYASTKC